MESFDTIPSRGGGGGGGDSASVERSRPSFSRPRMALGDKRVSRRSTKSTTTTTTTSSGTSSTSSTRLPSLKPSLMCSMTYRGAEVIFAAVEDKEEEVGERDHDEEGTGAWKDMAVGVCARTKTVFQTLDIPPLATTTTPRKVVSIVGHPVTGLVAVATSDGMVQTYYPVATRPCTPQAAALNTMTLSSSSSSTNNAEASTVTMRQTDDSHFVSETHSFGVDDNMRVGPVTAFGKYRWIAGRAIHCRDSFHMADDKHAPIFCRSWAPLFSPGGTLSPSSLPPVAACNSYDSASADDSTASTVHVSTSLDYRVLVSFRDELAVFDTTPPNLAPRMTPSGTPLQPPSKETMRAKLLWKTRVGAGILRSSFSGDGRAIAYVLRGEGEGVPYPFGVRTFIAERGADLPTPREPTPQSRHEETVEGRAKVERGEGDAKATKKSRSSKEKSRGRKKSASSSGKPERAKDGSAESKSVKYHRIHTLARPGAIAQPPVPEDARYKDKRGTVGAAQPTFSAVYKAGPFLVHSAPVTRLSFRGLGTVTSSRRAERNDEEEDEDAVHDEHSNDLLMTSCAADSTVRVYSQNSWAQLMLWSVPPCTRVDWVQGATSFNVGDLEPPPSKRRNTSATSSTAPSPTPLNGNPKEKIGDGGPGGSMQLVGGSGGNQHSMLDRPVTNPSSHPISDAGAWISELTFQGAYASLRLSRLCYLRRRGDEAAPACFESMSTILPPGSLPAGVVLSASPSGAHLNDEEGMRLSIHGIWSAWNLRQGTASAAALAASRSPEQQHQVISSQSATGGSAMAMLGAVDGAGSSGGGVWMGGYREGAIAAGTTHGPPSELRIVTSNTVPDSIVTMELSLWADQDLSSFELSSPLRHVLLLSNRSLTLGSGTRDPPKMEMLRYNSGTVGAFISSEGNSVALTWRKPGSVSLVPTMGENEVMMTIPATLREEMKDRSGTEDTSMYRDVGTTPLPLVLPPLCLPNVALEQNKDDAIVAVRWWPDKTFDGPPRLLAVTRAGTLVIFEMPPLWLALEPPMPSNDVYLASAVTSLAGTDHGAPVEDEDEDGDGDDDSQDGTRAGKEYEVSLTPHPDFGLGLRLEAQAEGMPAVAGSYKKHPLTGGMLPAEKTGFIVLGDELMSVNGISLEGVGFEEIIATVREIGADSKGGPMTMKFRQVNKRLRDTYGSVMGSVGSSSGSRRARVDSRFKGGSERTINTKNEEASEKASAAGEASKAEEMEGDEADLQEFGRVIAVFCNILEACDDDLSKRLIVLPWKSDYDSSSDTTTTSSAEDLGLLVYAAGKRVISLRMDLGDGRDPETVTWSEVSSIKGVKSALADKPRDGKTTRTQQEKDPTIVSLDAVGTDFNGWLVTALDDEKHVHLVEIGTGKTAQEEWFTRTYPMFGTKDMYGAGTGQSRTPIIRAQSIYLLAFSLSPCREVCIRSSLPLPPRLEDEDGGKKKIHTPSDYQISFVSHDGGKMDANIVDFQWMNSGRLDSFPWLITASSESVVLHRRPGSMYSWAPLVEISLPYLDRSCCFSQPSHAICSVRGCFRSPLDDFPHLEACMLSVVSESDENDLLRSDWHPESILSLVCTDGRGVRQALFTRVRLLFSWLSKWMASDEAARPDWLSISSLDVSPLIGMWNDEAEGFQDEEGEDAAKEGGAEGGGGGGGAVAESAENLMASLMAAKTFQKETAPPPPKSEAEALLVALQSALQRGTEKDTASTSQSEIRSREFLQIMETDKKDEESFLPLPIARLDRDELTILWAIGEVVLKPPHLKKLDTPGQLFSFCVSLFRHMEEAKAKERKGQESPLTLSSALSTVARGRSFLVKQSSVLETGPSEPKEGRLASSACLAALVSSHQARLVSLCRRGKEKLDWPMARQANLPFWLRSDDLLRQVALEIGQDKYKRTKDIVESALFFVCLRSFKTLRTMAATDQSLPGRTFYKFLFAHDFSSDRGRKAAEKNAFSLLRKRRYNAAAAFFLLSEPPMVKNALQVIVSQMEDLALAFMVARLMDASPGTLASGGTGLTLGGHFDLSKMGGGGGFASGISDAGVGKDEEELSKLDPYEDWKPRLGPHSCNLLAERGLHLTREDAHLSGIQLLWLGRTGEAAVRFSSHSTQLASHWCCDNVLARTICRKVSLSSSTSKLPKWSLHERTNAVINYASTPLLLRVLKVSKRLLCGSTMAVSAALSRCGMDVSSIQLLTVNDASDDGGGEEKENKTTIGSGGGGKASSRTPSTPLVSNISQEKQQEQSSIFDSFDVASKPKATPQKQAQSSIFDSFDVPKQQPVQSSIFDSFDVPKQQPVQSSIFDSFDVPKPPTQKPTNQAQSSKSNGPATNDMQSSIFDSYAVPNQPSAAMNGGMTSSIFDSFDPKPPARPQASAKGEMSSSIFDSFDVRPPGSAAKSKSVNGSANGVVAADKEEDKYEVDVAFQKQIMDVSAPALWSLWQQRLLQLALGRRLVREVAVVVDQFHGDLKVPLEQKTRNSDDSILPHGVAQVLSIGCDGDAVYSAMLQRLQDLCEIFAATEKEVLEQALSVLQSGQKPHRLVSAVLIHNLAGSGHLGEDMVREAAHSQVLSCNALAQANDDIFQQGKSLYQVASNAMNTEAARMSWQLELCLWLNRGGAVFLSTPAAKEATVAVRVGILAACWGVELGTLRKLIGCAPDCDADETLGRQLWSSLKTVLEPYANALGANKGGSGGWEFLVDCRRDEATQMLREAKTGSFLIRPHVDDYGVFTLSFRTDFTPQKNADEEKSEVVNDDAASSSEVAKKPSNSTSQFPPRSPTSSGKKTPDKTSRKEDVVQHAIIRLSDAGFRCGSFGPYSSLMKLLEAVSASLPFDLLFDEPPVHSLIRDQDAQPSPNSFLLRKLDLPSKGSKDFQFTSGEIPSLNPSVADVTEVNTGSGSNQEKASDGEVQLDKVHDLLPLRTQFGTLSQLTALTEIRKQICSVAGTEHVETAEGGWQDVGSSLNTSLDDVETGVEVGAEDLPSNDNDDGSLEDSLADGIGEDTHAYATRVVRPLITWCRIVEMMAVHDIAPNVGHVTQGSASMRVSVAASDTAIEAAPSDIGIGIDGGDAIIRRMIQPDSGIEFRTLRLGEGIYSASVVLFSRNDVMQWLVSIGAEKDQEDAAARLLRMEKRRVIERVNLAELAIGKSFAVATGLETPAYEKDIRYRFVDPWEVEALASKQDEVNGTSLGRERYRSFSIGRVADACEDVLQSVNGQHLLELWIMTRSSIGLTKALASVHAAWERDMGGDLKMSFGDAKEPCPYINAIRRHLYRNELFRRLAMPQRFVGLVQVELLDLKNLTAPGGSSSLTAYALLRIKRKGSTAPLSLKARTLDSAQTDPQKIGKSSGPNAPASWGSLVRFRFALPENVNCDGVSRNKDREALFKGPPSLLQVAVYEKKFMSDVYLGGADVKLDGLSSGNQLEEWVPLRAVNDGVTWFARIRFTLRFDLLNIEDSLMGTSSMHTADGEDSSSAEGRRLLQSLQEMEYPSAGLSKIRYLSQLGGAHEDASGVKRSVSTPDLITYLESMVY